MHRTDDGLGLSDGHAAMEHVEQAHNAAMKNYRLALMNFNRFILDGKLNSDESRPQVGAYNIEPPQ